MGSCLVTTEEVLSYIRMVTEPFPQATLSAAVKETHLCSPHGPFHGCGKAKLLQLLQGGKAGPALHRDTGLCPLGLILHYPHLSLPTTERFWDREAETKMGAKCGVFTTCKWQWPPWAMKYSEAWRALDQMMVSLAPMPRLMFGVYC